MRTYAIVGTSAASMGVLSKLRVLAPESRIICISASTLPPYNTCLLADYLAGVKSEQEVFTRPLSFFEKERIELRLGTRVVELKADQKKIVTASGEEVAYDILFLGIGTAVTLPPIAGLKQCNDVSTFHTFEDAQKLRRLCEEKKIKRVVCVGAGLSGIECSDALIAQGITVDVIEMNDRVLPSLVTREGSAVIEKRMRERGANVHCSTVVQTLELFAGRLQGVLLSNGVHISADHIVITTGGRVTLDFARQAGLAIEQGALQVNDFFQTSDPCIYAAGDAACVKDALIQGRVRSCMWPDAMLQGMQAAAAMTGTGKPYAGVCIVGSSRFYDLTFVSAGPITSPPPDVQKIEKQGDDFYHLFLLKENLLTGFLMVGNIENVGILKNCMLKKISITDQNLF